MLIDINSNTGHWPFRQTGCNTCRALLERMNRFGVDLSVIGNMNGIFYKDANAANEELYLEMKADRRYQSRFIPFAVLNPVYAGWRDDLNRCKNRFGFKGIRLYPMYHDYAVTDPACVDLVKTARDKGMVVAFTVRMVDSRSRSWMDIGKEWVLRDFLPLIKAVPDAKYFLLNISGGIQLSDDDAGLIKRAAVLMDTSGRNMANLPDLLIQYGKTRFAFGSHSPILDHLTGLLRIESLWENEADEQVKELLRSGNAKMMLDV